MKVFDINGNVVVDVVLNDDSVRYRSIMQVDSVTLKYSLPEHIELPIGAYIEYQGERYSLRKPENLKMHHSRYFEYTVTLESDASLAKIWKFRNPIDGRLKFTLTAKPIEHLQMFVDNMNRRTVTGETSWVVGECVDEAEHLIAYDYDFCLSALSKMANEFKTEFEIVGRKVSLKKVEYNKNSPLPVQYGRGNGIKSGVGRSSDEQEPTEFLYAQGGERNIDSSKYKGSTLHLPVSATLKYDGEHFDGEDGFNANAARVYKSDAQGAYITRADKQPKTFAEDALDCTDIYPSRVGVVSSIVEVDVQKHFYDFIDKDIPQDLDFSKCLIAGEKMTVIFQSGMLAGRELEVKYIHRSRDNKAGRRFEIVPQDIDGVTMPDDTFRPRVGDKYAVFHCALPDAYISNDKTKTGAEWDMFRKCVKHLYEHEERHFTYTAEIDGIWAKKNWTNIGGKLIVGGFVRFTDPRWQSSPVDIRIVGIKDYLNRPHSPTIELSNEPAKGGFSASMKKVESQGVLIDEAQRQAIQFTKRRFKDAQETMELLEKSLVGRFGKSINPYAVHAMQMIAGDESLQFEFIDTTTGKVRPLIVKFDSKHRQLIIDACTLKHHTLGIRNISSSHKSSEMKLWEIASFTSGDLSEKDKPYYLYVKCQKNSTKGFFELREEAISIDADPQNYFLLVGLLNSEHENERSFVRLYGFTEILPGRITTERVVSGNGDSYFDLVTNAMKLGDALDFNSKGDGVLRIKGSIVQSEGGAEAVIGCYRGMFNPSLNYYKGDEVTYEENGLLSTYRYINNVSSSGKIPPHNADFWQAIARGVRGADGTSFNFKGQAVAVVETISDVDNRKGVWLIQKGYDGRIYALFNNGALSSSVSFKTGDAFMVDDAMWVAGNERWINLGKIKGEKGDKGDRGAVVVFRGEFKTGEYYTGSSQRVDCVKYQNAYYVADEDAGDFKGIAPPNLPWLSFGASFSSVATELLLANGASIGNWFIKDGKIVSTLSEKEGIELDARRKIIKSYTANSAAPFAAVQGHGIDVVIDAERGIVETRDDANNSAYLSSTGVFANNAATSCRALSTGARQRASIVGHGRASLDKGLFDSSEDFTFVAGVFGDADNRGNANSYGGYFEHLKACGFIHNIQYVREATATIDEKVTQVVGVHPNATVYLPIGKREGQTIWFRQWWKGKMTVYAKDGQRIYDDHTPNASYPCVEGKMLVATFVRSYLDGEDVEAWLIHTF